jgi:hypothetical protein
MNLDEFNAVSSSFYSDEARALAWQGMGLGMNGGECPLDAPPAFRAAFEIGKAMRAKAEASIQSGGKGGENSVKARAEKYGTAQPKKAKVEGGFEGGFEGTFEGGIEGSVEPNDKRETNNDKRENEETKNLPPMSPKGDDAIIWESWSRMVKATGKGVDHIGWNPSWTKKVKTIKKMCSGKDFADVISWALFNASQNQWFNDKPSALTITHFLVPDNFSRYSANYFPQEVE